MIDLKGLLVDLMFFIAAILIRLPDFTIGLL